MKNEKKILLSTLGILVLNATLFACPVCEKQQPKLLQGITHGAGPQSNWDWVIIAVIATFTMLTLWFSLKYLLQPGEKNANHIKQFILKD